MEKPLRIKLHIISPVHIGCDDVYEPTGFVIDEKKKKLVEFDPMDFIKALNDKQRIDFSSLCSGNDLLAVFKFIKDNYKASIDGKEVDIVSGLVGHYKDVVDRKAQINKFEIKKTAYNPFSNQPYIPGSSLKGSLRTAYLSLIASSAGIKNWWNESKVKEKDRAKELEEKLLQGSFETDPFRMVKVSDLLSVQDVKTKIVYGVNKKKKKSEKPTKADSGPPQIFEVIQQGTVFEGLINIYQPLSKILIKNPVEADNLLKAIHGFYIKLFENEKRVAEEIGSDLIDVSNFNGMLGKSAFLIRIGRHSGAEAVTIEGNRLITIMQKKGDPPKYSKDGATTLWLASETSKPTSNNGLIPFGWALLEIIPFDVKNIYPSPVVKLERTITKSEEIVFKQETIPVTKTIQPQTLLWENAILSWSPGDLTLKANNKAILKFKSLDEVKKFVPESFHKKLFDKRDSIKANIKVEQTGNAFKIISVS
jgi:CRISPR-associated protein Csm5